MVVAGIGQRLTGCFGRLMENLLSRFLLYVFIDPISEFGTSRRKRCGIGAFLLRPRGIFEAFLYEKNKFIHGGRTKSASAVLEDSGVGAIIRDEAGFVLGATA
ncbi:hypothetical protein TIFTF001_023966 [Ficus carica]|uniref:Uncharacterized protein n=1 Tax=Ficus carica TaxID=3494 RepID=A0AA88B0D4_FICCA|nr:hypothetical protein TIFTF001_023966 [Ficus carica]